MDAYSFILGMSSVVVIAIAVVAVVGFFKVRKVDSDQKNLSVELDNRTRDIHDNMTHNFDEVNRRIDNETKDIHDTMTHNFDEVNRRIDNTEREIFSQLDSRLDKLENKIKNSQKEVLHS